MNKIALSAVVLIWATLSSQAQNVSPDELARRATERRAVDAVIWGMPAVNYDLMLQEMLTKTPGKVNQVIYWGRPLELEKPDVDPQSRHTLLHDLPQHEGRGTDRDRCPAGG